MTDPIVLTSTTVLRDLDGGTIPGGRYVWRGPASDPVFVLENCRDVVSSGVDVVCETPCDAVVVCERTRSAPGVIPSTNHGFTRWRIYGNGRAQYGFWYRGIDENNEHGRFECCSVYGCTFGWVFEGQQSKEHLITHSRFESGLIAVSADSGFQWVGGTCAQCVTGVHLTRVGEPVRIQGVGFESTGCVLITDGPSTASQSITLDAIRYEADAMHPDGDAVKLKHAGTLTITGSRLGGGKQRIPRIALLGVGEQSVSLRDNTFGSFGAHHVCPVRRGNGSTPRVSWSRNVYQRDQDDPRNTETRITWPEKAYA